MSVEELKYTKEHEWIRIEGDTAVVGITDYAQSELGDIVFVELPEIGSTITQKQSFGIIEAVKTVADLYAPVSGEVIMVNDLIEAEPALVNSDPYGDGWFMKVKLSAGSGLEKLLSYEEYLPLTQG